MSLLENPNLPAAVSHYAWLRERLQREVPDLDEDTLADTLEGLSDLPDMLAAVLRSAFDDEDVAAALKSRLAEMQARHERLVRRAETKRQLVVSAMERAEIKRISMPDFTATLRLARPPVIVIDEKSIPDAFWHPQPPKLDRQGLYIALRDGRDIRGACLDTPRTTLSVRTR